MNAEQTRTHYETLAKQAAGEKVDVLALMQLAADMLDTSEFAIDRETGRQLEAIIPLVAELINATKELRKAEWMVTHDWGGDRESVNRRVDAALARVVGAQS